VTQPETKTEPADEFGEPFDRAARWLGLAVTRDDLERLRRHYLLMVEVNRTLNLTRITDPAEAAVRHYADSLALIALAVTRRMKVASVLDLGTGAGFPAIPIAVVRPHWLITAIDATRKKAEFVRTAASELGLSNLTVEHAHADHWSDARQFDLVTARSVAPLSKLLTTAAGVVARGGALVAFKTATLDPAEADAARATAAKLRLRADEPFLYELQAGSVKLGRALYVFSSAG
jgi:16S rRNA (guanine527-N7)-methyltransferase